MDSDADGRLLTTKEEFRRLNYKFHGFGSGKKKEEKRQKKIQEIEAGGKLTGKSASQRVVVSVCMCM